MGGLCILKLETLTCLLLGCLFSWESSCWSWCSVLESGRQCRKHVPNRYLTLKIRDSWSWLRVHIDQATNLWIRHVSSGPSFTSSLMINDYNVSVIFILCWIFPLFLYLLPNAGSHPSLLWWSPKDSSGFSNPQSLGSFALIPEWFFLNPNSSC